MDCDICGFRSNATLFQKNVCFSCIHFFRNTMRFGRIYKCERKDQNFQCIIRNCSGCRIRKMYKEGFYSYKHEQTHRMYEEQDNNEFNLFNMLDIDLSDLIYNKVETKSVECQTDCTLMDMKRVDVIIHAYPFSVEEKRNIGKVVLTRILNWVMSLKVFNQLNKECRLGLFVNCWEQLFMLNMYAWPKEEIYIDFNENYRRLRLKLQGHNFSLEEIQSIMLSILFNKSDNLITTSENKDVILHYHNLIQQTMYASHSTERYSKLVDSFQDVSLFAINETILATFFESDVVWANIILNGLEDIKTK